MVSAAATDPAELRAPLARSGLKAYQLAALVERNPTSLSRMLRGRVPIPPALGQKILSVLEAKFEVDRPRRTR